MKRLVGASLIVLCLVFVALGVNAYAQVSVTVMPVSPTPSLSPVVSPAVPSSSPVAVSVTTVPTAHATAVNADIVDYGTDKDTYNRGDTAKGYITLKNTGNSVINDVTISVSIARSVPALGSTSLGSKDFKVTGLNIQPGETKKAEYSVSIPSEFGGFSTAGDYNVNGKAIVGGKDVGSFSKSIKVL